MSFLEFDILSSIANTSGKNDKRAILKANNANKRLHDLLDAAFNYKRKYFIKKWDDVTPQGTGVDRHADFISLLSVLESGVIRGDKATQAVQAFLAECTADQSTWYTRVLRRDLKAGFGVDSSIDSGFDIPLFEVQLAKDGKSCKKILQMIKDGLLASRKFDGYRCLALVENGEVTLFTRNGEVFHNFPGVEESLLTLCGVGCYVFDGEVMSTNFNSTQKSAFASKRKTAVGDMIFHIFDMIPYDEWVADSFKRLAFDRYNDLNAFMSTALQSNPSVTNIKVVDRVLIKDLQHILDLELQYILEGHEGAMANPNIPYYKGKHSNKMLKFKTFKSMDCEVISAYRGEAGKKYEHTLGGFTVRQENGVLCDVGGGYDDSERDELWENQDQLISRVMEVEYHILSDEDKRMRFPVFKRWRPDKDKV